MGSIRSHCVGFHTNPPLPPDIQFDFNISHVPSFPGGSLRPFRNLSISSCDLGGSSKPLKFSVLLGRDVMSCWTIVWDGPSSTVIIND